jgi:CHASE2 domain-containing sensor protein/predicted Ser/Thr protein kinase
MSKYTSYILYLLLSILVVILYVNDFGPMVRLQQSINDVLCSVTASDVTPANVALVKIDAQAQKEFGDWPWNQDRTADLLAAVAGAEPKAILLDIELPEDASQDSAGYTEILAGQLSWAKNTILPYDIAISNFRSSKTSNPKYLFRNSIAIDNPVGVMSEASCLNARKVFLPAEKLLEEKSFLGFDYECPDNDRVLRHQPMVMNYEGYYYPSAPLLASALYLGVQPEKIKVVEGKQILIGSQRSVPINANGEYYVNFVKHNPFTQYSAAKVLGDNFDFKNLRDKLVIIGVDDPQFVESFATAVTPRTSSLQIGATVVENIINSNFITVKDRSPLFDLLVMFGLGALGAYFLPRLRMKYRLILPVAAIAVATAAGFVAASSFRMLPQTVYFCLEFVLFMAAAPLLDMQMLSASPTETTSVRKKVPKVRAEKRSEPTPAHADDAHVRELVSQPTDQENLLTAAVPEETGVSDTHTRPLDDNVIAADETRASAGSSDSGGISSGFDRFAQPLEHNAIGADNNIDEDDSWAQQDSGGVHPNSQELMLSGDQSELKNLGRYQVTGTLGKGAMGLVYKGIDPAINRPVALKTIRLDFVNDPAEFEELKERLYREAQAAGKLSHPNIVTIYDVGSEGPLQYIAMEYLEGQTLEHLIKKKTKFNYRIIAQIITQICSALDYAHERGIVHRDIKPANVMVLNDYRVKVMDFGIARIDSNSMTKTGIAMGTPNYISPEQLRGLAIDRRADLFSLGVVMYEMLLGRRPFKGENITSLIYSILHHEPEKPSNVNPQIPLLFDHIVARALRKNPAERYQKATEITTDLHDFIESFVNR